MSPPSKNGKKPPKPYADFPLFPHGNGQWCKKIRNKLRFFGVWADPQAAVDLYERQREALYAGRTPSEPSEDVTVAVACNAFLTAKKSLLSSGDLTQRSYDDYYATCGRILNECGRERTVPSLEPSDFDALRAAIAERLGPVALGNEVNRVRMVFRYAYEATMIDSPVRFGPHFKRPSAKALRIAKEERGDKLFTAAEIRKLLDSANDTFRAMIYLGINAGLGNADISRLQHQHIDGSWLNYPRPKTGIRRRCRLWQETLTALRRIPRRMPRSDLFDGIVFLTVNGRPWGEGKSNDQPIALQFTRLLKATKVFRPGLSFYALRHTFQTIAEESKDLPAVRYVMGHVPPANDMGSVYRESISDARLINVSRFVRNWLHSTSKKRAKKVS
jgi:integrase